MQRIFLVTMLSRLVKAPKGSIGSPVTPTQPLNGLTDSASYSRHMALSVAVTSTIEGVIADVSDKKQHCLHREADPVEAEIPIEGLMKMLTNFHINQTSVWQKAMFGHQSGKISVSTRSTTPPSLIAGPQMSPPGRQATNSARIPLFRQQSDSYQSDDFNEPPASSDTPTVLHLSSTSANQASTPPIVLPLSLVRDPSVPSQGSSPVSTTELDTLVAMWSPIVTSIIRLLTHVSPQRRDGSVREESYSIVTCCLQLCRWPSLLAHAIRCFVKSWPHKADSPHKMMLIDMMMTMLNNFAEVPLCTESVLVHEVRAAVVYSMLNL